MDEIAKTEARNYLMAAGFFNWALMFAVLFAAQLSGTFSPAAVPFITGIIGAGIGIALIILRKRDMAGVLILFSALVGFMHGFAALNGLDAVILSKFLALGQILLALVILTGSDRKKWLLFIMPILDGGHELLSTFIPSPVLSLVISAVITVVALYLSFVCAFERVSLPGRSLLTADETQDFKASGSAIGYMMLAMMMLIWVCLYIFGTDVMSADAVYIISSYCSIGLIISAVLLLFVAKMRFTPVMFLLTALLSLLSPVLSGSQCFILGIGFIIVGIYAMMRKESRILPGIMLIVYGVTYFLTVGITGDILHPGASMLLNLIPCLIAVYLAFAVFSRKKLPLI